MLVTLALLALSQGDPLELSTSRATLRAAGFADDGDGAIAYLKTWIPDPDRLALLRRHLARLGDDDFEKREEATRELRKAGFAVLADLQRLADHRDLEIRRRARELLDTLQAQSPSDAVVSACRVLAATRPEGMDVVLLQFAPHSPDREAEAALLAAADRLKLSPAVRAARTDADPLRRRLALRTFAAAGAEHRETIRAALTDTDLRVRFEVGRALVRLGEREGIAVLVECLDRGDLNLALRAEDLLWQIARESAPAMLLKTAADREPVRTAWQKWLQDHGEKVNPLAWREDEKERGIILVADDEKIGQSPGHIRVFDLQGKLLSKAEKMESPSDVALLTGGRLLVAEHWSGKVTERDSVGRILWEHKTADKPVVALRLPDGATFIVTYHEILEVERSGKVRYTLRPDKGMLYGAVRLSSGRILCINGSGDIFETDRTGTIHRQFKPQKYAEGASYWASIEVIGPERYLLSLSGANRVVEIDGTGKVHWEAEAKTPTYAQRMADGNTLVSCVDAKNYVIIDPTGKTIQTVTVGGRPFRARRY